MLNDEEAEHRADSMQTAYTIREAMDHKQKAVDWRNAIGRISAEFVIVYPPGAPLLVRGSDHAGVERKGKALSESGTQSAGDAGQDTEATWVLRYLLRMFL